MPPLIELGALRRSYPTADGETVVLDDVSLSIQAGELVVILGPSGCGKSSLLNIIGGLDRGFEGSYRVAGVDVASLDDNDLAMMRRCTFGFVLQQFALIPTLTCRENIELPAIYHAADPATRRTAAERLLERLGVTHRTGYFPTTLSGGEQQRIAIGRALINDAQVMLADEPTGALDSTNSTAVIDSLRGLNRDGKTVIIVTHDAELFRPIASRIVEMRDGRIVKDSRGVTPRAHPQMPRPPPGPLLAQTVGGNLDKLAQAALMGLRALAQQRLQSALTVLGIAIGAAAVIAMLTIGDGARRQVIDRITALGADIVTVSRGPPGVRGAERTVVTLVQADAAVIARVRGVGALTPEIDGVITVRYQSRDFIVTASGVSEDFTIARDWPVVSGGFFDQAHVERYSPVAVLGATAAQNLSPTGDFPIGDYILIGNAPFRVIGIMARKGVTTGPGHDRDNQVWLPYTTASARVLGRTYIDRVVVKVGEGIDPDSLAADLRSAVLARHGVEDFSVNTIAEVIRTAARTQRTFDYLLAAIAAISLIVGGIGVMNIMLSSVSARTREIGIRMTVGASRRDVLTQFVVEALVICLIGGMAGTLLGIAIGWITAAVSGITVVTTAGPLLLALASAALTGLTFGLLPARRAAALDPIEAYRRG